MKSLYNILVIAFIIAEALLFLLMTLPFLDKLSHKCVKFFIKARSLEVLRIAYRLIAFSILIAFFYSIYAGLTYKE